LHYYEGALNPVAELDGAGAVVARFVYATRGHVPDYMVKGSGDLSLCGNGYERCLCNNFFRSRHCNRFYG